MPMWLEFGWRPPHLHWQFWGERAMKYISFSAILIPKLLHNGYSGDPFLGCSFITAEGLVSTCLLDKDRLRMSMAQRQIRCTPHVSVHKLQARETCTFQGFLQPVWLRSRACVLLRFSSALTRCAFSCILPCTKAHLRRNFHCFSLKGLPKNEVVHTWKIQSQETTIFLIFNSNRLCVGIRS